MAKGNPYADPESGARYLPGYSRQVVGTHGPTAPDTSGFKFARQHVESFWRDVEKFAGAATNLAATYYEIREQRDIRDTETLIDETIRQRKIDTFSSKTGKAADNLIEAENEWQLKAREDIIKKSGLAANMASTLWDKKAQQYLTRVGAYMIEQNRVAEAQSRYAAEVSAQNDLALSPVGDFRAYAQYSAKINDLYGPLTKEAIMAKEKGIDVLVDSWTEQNPQGTLKWFNQNKEGLRQVMGREFADVSRAMERTRNRLESQVRRAEMQEIRNIRLAEQAQKRADRQYQSETITKILTDENVDIRQVVAEGAKKGISGDTLLTIQKVFENRENVSLKDTSGTLRSTYQGKATLEGLSDEDRDTLTKALAAKQILPADYQAIISADDRTKKAESGGLKELRKGALQHLHTAIAPRGAFDTVNQTAENMYERLARELDVYVEQLGSPNEKRAAMDISNPNSFVMQLINLNAAGKTPIDRVRGAYSTGPFDPNSPIKLPEDQMRKQGESYGDWLKRTGK